jgi:hypothetical protein
MSIDRRYIVSFEPQPYMDDFPHKQMKEIEEHDNIYIVNQFDEYCFFVECNKRSEDDLIKNL